jgi:hypothetical protein
VRSELGTTRRDNGKNHLPSSRLKRLENEKWSNPGRAISIPWLVMVGQVAGLAGKSGEAAAVAGHCLLVQAGPIQV